ncbi:MAG: sulfotransferase [Candidatus Hydrogenedentes bacterium]|nr:sulfotransferase [Candidatus Hydrogenedentota bacterium]
MSVPLIFVIGAPRSGTTLLERMLESHSMILGGPEPHLLTPLAHLGYFDKVDKAPYDHILAAESQRLFVEQLPGKEQDYIDACRAYCDVLYGRVLANSGKRFFLDKTPAYALVLPFIQKLFPDAKYVVLTRHPLAILSSYANSFFDGDYQAAQNYNPILHRYVPAMARFLREKRAPYFHVRYEDLVTDPETWMGLIYAYLGVPFEKETINYGEGANDVKPAPGLGDPIGVTQHSRPSTASLNKWATELAGDSAKLEIAQTIIRQLDPDDLRVFGFPLDGLWTPLDAAQGSASTRRTPLTRYRLQRKLIVSLRSLAKSNAAFRRLLAKTRLAADVLLRE